jgi:hypothetical protein
MLLLLCLGPLLPQLAARVLQPVSAEYILGLRFLFV